MCPASMFLLLRSPLRFKKLRQIRFSDCTLSCILTLFCAIQFGLNYKRALCFQFRFPAKSPHSQKRWFKPIKMQDFRNYMSFYSTRLCFLVFLLSAIFKEKIIVFNLGFCCCSTLLEVLWDYIFLTIVVS